MNPSADPRRRLRMFGGIWIALAPVLFLMAAISTVDSITTYYVELTAFSAVAFAGFAGGVGGLCRHVWAGYTMLALSLAVGAYFCGSALMLFLWPFLPWTAANFHWLMLLLCPVIAGTGVPFLLMAWSLRRILRDIPRSSELA